MLKRLLIAASLVALAACGVGTAHAAQPGATTFVAANGDVLSTENLLYVEPSEKAPGMLNFVYVNGNESLFYSGNGLLNRVLVAMPYLVQVQGTSRWINPNKAARITCSGGVLYFGQFSSGTTQYADPGCLTTNQIKGNSVQ